MGCICCAKIRSFMLFNWNTIAGEVFPVPTCKYESISHIKFLNCHGRGTMAEWFPFVRFKPLFLVSLSATEKKKNTPHKECLIILLIKNREDIYWGCNYWNIINVSLPVFKLNINIV